jgi:hypothetical protein
MSRPATRLTDDEVLELRLPAWCVGCGRVDYDARDSMPTPDNLPTAVVRVCPPCWDDGWRLEKPVKTKGDRL